MITHSLTHSLTPAALRALPVAGPGENLRDLVRAAYADGGISDATLRDHGIDPSRFGGFIASAKKSQCLALLSGEAPPSLNLAPPAANAGDAGAALAAMIAPHLAGLGIGGVTTDQLDDLRDTLIAEAQRLRPTSLEIITPAGAIIALPRQHFIFPALLVLATARQHAFLVGPAGSGKTSVCHAVAEALTLPFYAISVCQQSTKTDLLGFVVPGTGAYFPTDFRRAFENGGVFVLDEIDNGNANVLAVLNAALSNGQMSFPDGMIKRHADFVLIAAGNTYGQGADRLYVGRNQLDAATLDRFAFVTMDYDQGLEAHICGVSGVSSPTLDLAEGGSVTPDQWLSFVLEVRAAVERLSIRAVISPRASISGAKLAAYGFGRVWLERMLIWRGMQPADIAKIKSNMGGNR